MLRVLDPAWLEGERGQETAAATLRALLEATTSGSAKVRWNACYGIGNAFRNVHLPHKLQVGWLAMCLVHSVIGVE